MDEQILRQQVVSRIEWLETRPKRLKGPYCINESSLNEQRHSCLNHEHGLCHTLNAELPERNCALFTLSSKDTCNILALVSE
jgi:hypothetical protein